MACHDRYYYCRLADGITSKEKAQYRVLAFFAE